MIEMVKEKAVSVCSLVTTHNGAAFHLLEMGSDHS